jgi:hypothetical protein
MNDFGLPHMKHGCQAFHREQVAANVAEAEVVPLKHVADGLGCPVDLLGNFLDRPLYKFLSDNLDLRASPSPVVLAAFDPVLNDQTPTCLLGPSGVPLDSNDQLLKFATGEHSCLSRHSQGYRTPLASFIRRFQGRCHCCLVSAVAVMSKAEGGDNSIRAC